MSALYDRRRMLFGTVLLAGAAAAPSATNAACTPLRERWPRKNELVGGNDRELILKTARAMMVKLGHAALVTMDDGFLPRVRSLGTRDPDDEMTVWMMTHPVSHKVAQIRARPEVALHYVDIDEMSEVTLMGTASLHDDAETLRAKNFYSDEQTAKYWPGFPKGYVMIAVRPSWLEISAPGTPIKGDKARWRPAGLEH